MQCGALLCHFPTRWQQPLLPLPHLYQFIVYWAIQAPLMGMLNQLPPPNFAARLPACLPLLQGYMIALPNSIYCKLAADDVPSQLWWKGCLLNAAVSKVNAWRY